MKTHKVYFAEQARFALLDDGPIVRAYLRNLRKVDGAYLASTRQDYLALRPFEHSPPHQVS